MATTYELIASNVLGADTATVSLTSIPATYTDLLLVMSARSTHSGVADILIGFNTSTASFSARYLYGTGAATGSSTLARYLGAISGTPTTANTFGSNETYIPNYAGSTNKSYSTTNVIENNAASSSIYTEAIAGLWSNTAAIASIELATSSGSFLSGSSFQLYGIKNADDGGRGYFGPAVTGGDEVFTTGNGYKVHVFKNSGTLNVTAPGEVEYLVVGGGGGGGSDRGGGGGGGGYRSSVGGENSGGGSTTENKLNLNIGNKTIIIGAGGIGNNYYTAGTSGSNSSLDNITSYGGGGGGSGLTGVNNGTSGGSGGGGGTNGTGGSGTISQGYSGGNALTTDAGGGGGAGSIGVNGTSISGGNGGAGISSIITGSSVGRAGGGGGGAPSGDSGGSATDGGGAGRGGDTGTGGVSATTNTGGGGGGGTGGPLNLGGLGGSGIVIIRYRI